MALILSFLTSFQRVSVVLVESHVKRLSFNGWPAAQLSMPAPPRATAMAGSENDSKLSGESLRRPHSIGLGVIAIQ
jgi:hypothetical protein